MKISSFFRRKFKKKRLAKFISKSSELDYLNTELLKSNIIGIDTEFDWRTTYFPKLSLVQIVTLDKIFIVDFLNIASASSLISSLENNDCLKIFHSARSDAIVLSKCLNCKSRNVFDIQIAEKLLLNGEIQSYGKIVERYFGLKLDKMETNSNWLKRPLTENQIIYAQDDVDYLIEIYEIQKKILKRKDLLNKAFMLSEREADLGNQPLINSRLKKKVKKFSKRDKEVFIWRENQAEKEDVPPSFIFKDKYINHLSKILPIDTSGKKKVMKIIGDSEISERFIKKFL
ncbi:MAG: HRDC domain-containing protein [Gammaproteobacteria bacterium]